MPKGPIAGDGTGSRGHTAPQHVWMRPAGQDDPPAPGLLLEWSEPGAHGWAALVLWVEGGGIRPWRVHLDQAPAVDLRPLGGWAPPAPARRSPDVVPRHVWTCVTGRWDEASAALLVDWRPPRPAAAPPSWTALTASATGGGNRDWDGRLRWALADHVRPVVAERSRPDPARQPRLETVRLDAADVQDDLTGLLLSLCDRVGANTADYETYPGGLPHAQVDQALLDAEHVVSGVRARVRVGGDTRRTGGPQEPAVPKRVTLIGISASRRWRRTRRPG